MEPLLENTFVFPGYYTATLFIYNATVENTGYYMCTYESREGDADSELEEENETGIYVFVPGKRAVSAPLLAPRFSLTLKSRGFGRGAEKQGRRLSECDLHVT